MSSQSYFDRSSQKTTFHRKTLQSYLIYAKMTWKFLWPVSFGSIRKEIMKNEKKSNNGDFSYGSPYIRCMWQSGRNQ